MFVQHKQLKVLTVPAAKVARLKTSASKVQLALSGYPPQFAEAFLVALSGGSKVLIVVGFYLEESNASIFYVPKQGEVPVEGIEQVFEEGFVFAESMGFVLTETDYHLLTGDDQQKLWQDLPICQVADPVVSPSTSAVPVKGSTESTDLDRYRQRSLESLGRFLASM